MQIYSLHIMRKISRVGEYFRQKETACSRMVANLTQFLSANPTVELTIPQDPSPLQCLAEKPHPYSLVIVQ